MSRIGTLLTVALLLAVVGCDGQDNPAGTTNPNAPGDEVILAPFSVAAPLVEFDDTTADQHVDGGLLTLKLLTDWKEKNDRRGNLFVFLKEGKSYPTLIVHKPEDAGELQNLDDSNKSAYLAEVSPALTDKYKQFLLDKPRLVEINKRPWIFYRVKMASLTEKLEVPFLVTIANGRKYTLEMRAIDKKGNHDWPALLTMASGLTFGEAKSSAEPLTPGEEPLEKTEPEKPGPEKTEPAQKPVEAESTFGR